MPILKVKTISGEILEIKKEEVIVYIHPKSKECFKISKPGLIEEFDFKQIFKKDYLQTNNNKYVLCSKIETFWFE